MQYLNAVNQNWGHRGRWAWWTPTKLPTCPWPSFLAWPSTEYSRSYLKSKTFSFSDQLNEVPFKLRALTVPDDAVLGGVYGEGCKNTRSHARICQEPISTTAGFEDFKFSNPRFGGSGYITLLCSLGPSDVADNVFSHRDLRPENILVQLCSAWSFHHLWDHWLGEEWI